MHWLLYKERLIELRPMKKRKKYLREEYGRRNIKSCVSWSHEDIQYRIVAFPFSQRKKKGRKHQI